MKVIVITQQFPILSETFVVDHVQGIRKAGAEVSVYALSPQESNEQKFEGISIFRPEIPLTRTRRIFKIFSILFKNFHKIYKIFRVVNIFQLRTFNRLIILDHFLHNEYDVIHCHFGTMAKSVSFLKRAFPHSKFVVSFHGYDVHKYPKENGSNIYKELFSLIDMGIANTQFTKNTLIDLGCISNKIFVIPVGFDVGSANFFERSLQLNEKVKFICIARMVEKKGHVTYLKLFMIFCRNILMLNCI
jgi:colanic acid/amylovoran biosynthesis glycosyltransferase